MLYFAYGSNLDPVQMKQRCPGAEIVGPARLPDHRLCFPRRSPIRLCAVASVEPHPGSVVHGVLYEVGESDMARLDAREGYDPAQPDAVHRYRRVGISVLGPDDAAMVAEVYIAVPEPEPGLPSPDYMRHIIDGALAHAFPEDYLALLRGIPVTAAD